MSGDFTQRGEPALADKWDRAETAARHGISLVLELPFIYACSRAEDFASAAVDILAEAGVTHISFGCEAEKPEMLERLADLRTENAGAFEAERQALMSGGLSFAKAGELASRRLFGDELTGLSLLPNNILALEYLRRIRFWREKGRRIIPVPIVRKGSGYAGADLKTGFAGGSALRKMAAEGKDISPYLPYSRTSWSDLPEAREKLYMILRGIIMRSAPEELAMIRGVGEGMENRLKQAAVTEESYSDFLSYMTSKRYTASAIRRIMICILLGCRKTPGCVKTGETEMNEAAQGRLCSRVLAADADGRVLLKALQKKAENEEKNVLPFVTSNQQIRDLPESMRQSLLLDEAASDLYHLITGKPVDRYADGRRHPFMGI